MGIKETSPKRKRDQLEALMERSFSADGGILDSRELVRQVLKGIEAPTRAMVVAGGKALAAGDARPRAAIDRIWRAMIGHLIGQRQAGERATEEFAAIRVVVSHPLQLVVAEARGVCNEADFDKYFHTLARQDGGRYRKLFDDTRATLKVSHPRIDELSRAAGATGPVAVVTRNEQRVSAEIVRNARPFGLSRRLEARSTPGHGWTDSRLPMAETAGPAATTTAPRKTASSWRNGGRPLSHSGRIQRVTAGLLLSAFCES